MNQPFFRDAGMPRERHSDLSGKVKQEKLKLVKSIALGGGLRPWIPAHAV